MEFGDLPHSQGCARRYWSLWNTGECIFCSAFLLWIIRLSLTCRKFRGLLESEIVQLSKTRWACQLRSVNALMVNITASLRCLGEIATSTAVGLLSKLCRLLSVYLLVMLWCPLEKGLCKYFLGEKCGNAGTSNTKMLWSNNEFNGEWCGCPAWD